MCLLVGMPNHNHFLFAEINHNRNEKKDVLPVSIGNFTLNTAKKKTLESANTKMNF